MGLKMANIRKFLFLSALGLVMSFVSVTSAYAVVIDPCVPRPGCSCRFLSTAGQHADANRVRDKAYARQIPKQADNTMGMNCYDKMLLVSSRGGQIFSDTAPATPVPIPLYPPSIYPPGSFPAANYVAWDPSNAVNQKVYDDSAGVGVNPNTGESKLLSANYRFVFELEAKNHASDNNFADTLSKWLGATIMNLLGGFLDSLTSGIGNILTTINGFVTTVNGYFTTLQGYIDTIQYWLDFIGAALPVVVGTTVTFIQGLWTSLVGTVTGLINGVQTAISNLVGIITGYLQGLIGSMMEYMGSDEDPCARIKRLWNPDSVSGQSGTGGGGGIMSLVFLGLSVLMDPGAGIMTQLAGGLDIPGFRPMEGGGIERGAPYFDFNALVKRTGMVDPMNVAIRALGAATDLTDELNNALNAPILAAALADLNVGGLLNAREAPGPGVIWPTIPAVAVDPSPFTLPPDAAAIIGTSGAWPPTDGLFFDIINAM